MSGNIVPVGTINNFAMEIRDMAEDKFDHVGQGLFGKLLDIFNIPVCTFYR